MWFLLFQISTLLLLAAALGAGLMWWWMKRRYDEVSESHERLMSNASGIAALATREDVEKELAALSGMIREQKPVDMGPVEERLLRLQYAISEIKIPQTDLGPLHERLARLEKGLAAFSLDPVMARVGDVGVAVSRIPPADLRPLDERLSRLEGLLRNLRMPEVDLGPVHSGIATLGLAVNALEAPVRGVEPLAGRIAALEARLGDLGGRLETARRNDMDALAARFASLSSAISGLRMPDMAPVNARLSDIQGGIAGLVFPMTDLSPLHASLGELERTIMLLDKPPPDLTPLNNRFTALESALKAVQSDVREARALQPIDRRLAGIQEAIGSMPGPDLEPVIGAVRAIDNRHDLVAMENRLTAIEYGLAAIHHMLRSRQELSVRNDGNGSTHPVAREVAGLPAPTRPPRDSDPINVARRQHDQANLLAEPAFGAPDDLEQIEGVGPMLRALLHDIGIYYFWQVAEWTPEEVNWVESKLMHFRGRIRRDDWVGHARTLAAAPAAAKRPGSRGSRAAF